jgi:hypothetical protein
MILELSSEKKILNNNNNNHLMILNEIKTNVITSKSNYNNSSHKKHLIRDIASSGLNKKDLKKILLLSEKMRKQTYAKNKKEASKKLNNTPNNLNIYHSIKNSNDQETPQLQKEIHNNIQSANNLVKKEPNITSVKFLLNNKASPYCGFDEKSVVSYDVEQIERENSRFYCPLHNHTNSDLRYFSIKNNSQNYNSFLFKKYGQIAYNQKKIRKKLRENSFFKKNLLYNQNTNSNNKSSHIYFKAALNDKNTQNSSNKTSSNELLLATTDLESIFSSISMRDYQFTLDCMNSSHSSGNSDELESKDCSMYATTQNRHYYNASKSTSTRKNVHKHQQQKQQNCYNQHNQRNVIKITKLNSSNAVANKSSETKKTLTENISSTTTGSTSTSSSSSSGENSGSTYDQSRMETSTSTDSDEQTFEYARADDDYDTVDQMKSDDDDDNLADSSADLLIFKQFKTINDGLPEILSIKNEEYEILNLFLHRLPGKNSAYIFTFTRVSLN